MPRVEKKHPNEPFESLMRRFKKSVENDDVIKDYRKHEYFEKPTEKRKRRKAAAVKRWERLRQEMEPGYVAPKNRK